METDSMLIKLVTVVAAAATAGVDGCTQVVVTLVTP